MIQEIIRLSFVLFWKLCSNSLNVESDAIVEFSRNTMLTMLTILSCLNFKISFIEKLVYNTMINVNLH